MDIRLACRALILIPLVLLPLAQPAELHSAKAAQFGDLNVTQRIIHPPGQGLSVSQLRTLNISPIAGATVYGMAITSDSRRVVYTQLTSKTELYSIPLSGGAAIKLNGPLATGTGGIQWFNMGITADNAHVVYLAQLETDSGLQLYIVPITGGASTKLNSPLSSGETLQRFFFSPDGRYVVYTTNRGIYSVPLGGGAIRLNLALASGESLGDPMISHDSSHVVYRVDHQAVNGTVTSSHYAVPITGGSPIKLDGPFPYPTDVPLFEWISPDSRYLVTTYRQRPADPIELYAIPIAGGQPMLLARPADRSLDTRSIDISPDSRWVTFRTNQAGSAAPELYSSSLSGASPANKLYEATNGTVRAHRISPDGSRVVFTAAQGPYPSNEIYSVPIAGGQATKLNTPIDSGGPPVETGFSISPDSSRVAYMSTVGEDQLFSAPIDGITLPVKLNGPMIPSGFISFDYAFTPDSRYVLYRAEGTAANLYDLFSTSSAGGVAARKLNDTVPTVAGYPTDIDLGYVISRDSRHVVFRGSQIGGAPCALYVADIAESGGPTISALGPNTALAGGGTFTLSVDGANFRPGAVVQWNGASRSTTFVSSIRLTAQISKTDLAAAGVAQVAVHNPEPDSDTSNIAWFYINSPEPSASYRSFLPLVRG